jgi:hypothetical protein
LSNSLILKVTIIKLRIDLFYSARWSVSIAATFRTLTTLSLSSSRDGHFVMQHTNSVTYYGPHGTVHYSVWSGLDKVSKSSVISVPAVHNTWYHKKWLSFVCQQCVTIDTEVIPLQKKSLVFTHDMRRRYIISSAGIAQSVRCVELVAEVLRVGSHQLSVLPPLPGHFLRVRVARTWSVTLYQLRLKLFVHSSRTASWYDT